MSEGERNRPLPAWAHHGEFFRGWLRNPRTVGAILPSSQSVAKLLVTGIRPGAKVIELGAGTGTVTQAILDAGVAPEDLLLLEKDKGFARFLMRRFPGVHIVNADALALDQFASQLSAPPDFVVSGLPLLLFSTEEKNQLLEHVFSVLAESGRFHQFSYIARYPLTKQQIDALRIRASLIGVAPFNVPPAFVYRLRRSTADHDQPSLLRASLRMLGIKNRRAG
jgi:phospholipid N-methyltransferase